MKFKKTALFLHRWLGIITGLVVFIVSITGATFVFEEELFALFNPKLCTVKQPIDKELLPFSTLYEKAQTALGKDKPITAIRIPATAEKNKSYAFDAREQMDKENLGNHLFINQQIDHWDRVFIDPYTGAFLGKIDMETNFFWIARQIHQFLYLRSDVGSIIVGTSTLLFIIISITGLILWWPKNRKVAIKRLKINPKAKWKRLNYDLHQVLGFYVFLFTMLIAITGLVWSFKWWEGSIYWLLDGKRPSFKIANPKGTDTEKISQTANKPLDILWEDLQHKHTSHEGMNVTVNKENNQISTSIYFKDGSGWHASDVYAYDLRNGENYFKRLQQDKTLGMKWRNSNYNIHVGKIAGLPGMILAFLGSLICVSLPVTGFIVWYNRTFKKKKSKR